MRRAAIARQAIALARITAASAPRHLDGLIGLSRRHPAVLGHPALILDVADAIALGIAPEHAASSVGRCWEPLVVGDAVTHAAIMQGLSEVIS